jgi:hypothetical protein
MKIKFCLIFCLLVSGAFLAPGQQKLRVKISNKLAIDRRSESVTIPLAKLGILARNAFQVRDADTGKVLLKQLIDNNADGTADELLFQVDISSRAEKTVIIEQGESATEQPGRTTYSRFVPERIDDYAWENDLVAFRTYGPKAQQIVDEGKPGGTLSSGMDCWLKRVDYPIIDKWYKKNETGGSYHKDNGEGLDNYHVGASRGCGGIGVWIGDSLYVSKNFTSYKTISNGPLRTIFELTYAPWSANGVIIKEKKRISLDVGSQLTKYEVTLESSGTLPNCTAGITLHNKAGVTQADASQGWFSYWEPLDDSELGTGIVAAKKDILSHLDYRTPKKDLSQLYVMLKPVNNKVVYYAGFGWKKAGRFSNAADWNNYLKAFAEKLQSPLEVKITKE